MTGRIDTLVCSEIDGYTKKHIEQNLGLDNAGCISQFSVPERYHAAMTQEDVVPVEQTGLTTVTYEDFYAGAVDFPQIISGGFPCQNVTSANLKDDTGFTELSASKENA